ncbi:MAG: hypothetical protein GY784_03860, partial [Gammaproteobacteria bacterium]|nr:hypothetical protein [Gammaproteobacteria bacterium]
MREKLPRFIAYLIFGLGIFFFLAWLGSVYIIVSLQSQATGLLEVFLQLGLPVLLLVLVAATVVYLLIYMRLLKPAQQLAENMARLASSRDGNQPNRFMELAPDFEQTPQYLTILKSMLEYDSSGLLSNRVA